MYDIRVARVYGLLRSDIVYDINAVVLIHYSENYVTRVAAMKKFGFLKYDGLRVHLTLIASQGDGKYYTEIVNGWPSCFDVIMLEMSSRYPIPKMHGYYCWLRNAVLNARWHLRVDDDSITDLSALLRHADDNFCDVPVHLMTSPIDQEIGEPIFGRYFRQHAIEMPSMMHEYESSLTSSKGMLAVLNNDRAMAMIEDTGRLFSGPCDRVLAFAMHMCGVSAVVNPISTKDFHRAQMSVVGGVYAHVHYVNWSDREFTGMLGTLLHTVLQPFTNVMATQFVEEPVYFGRCIAERLTTLTLKKDGSVVGSNHDNETYWSADERGFHLRGRDHGETTTFTTLFQDDKRALLVGRFRFEPITHYLERLVAAN